MKIVQTVVVIGIAVNDKNEFLITLRHQPDLPLAHNKWQLPGGGVEPGELIHEALKREMKEEVNIDVELLDYPPIVTEETWKHPNKIIQAVLIGYVCKIVKGTISIDQDEETADFQWIKAKKILKLSRLPATDNFILQAQKYLALE